MEIRYSNWKEKEVDSWSKGLQFQRHSLYKIFINGITHLINLKFNYPTTVVASAMN
jgi:hypothetical protein